MHSYSSTHKTKLSMKKRVSKRENSWKRDIWLFAQACGFFTCPPRPLPKGALSLIFWRFEKGGMERSRPGNLIFWVSFHQGESSGARPAGRQGGSLRENHSELNSVWGRHLGLGLLSSFCVSISLWHHYHCVNIACFCMLGFLTV